MKSLPAALLALVFFSSSAVAAPETRPVNLYGAEEGGLYEAALTGDLGAAKRRLTFYRKPDDDRDAFGATPLMVAAEHGHVEIMKLLIDKGAGVNAMTKQGFSVLQFAADGGQLEAARLLVEKGADVRHRDKKGATPLYEAAQFGGAPGGTVGGGSVEIARLLIDKGADVNAALDTVGGTPLLCAAQKGNRELVELLIASGADSNAKSGFFGTPLNVALRRARSTGDERYKAVVDLLAARGGRDEGPATRPATPG